MPLLIEANLRPAEDAGGHSSAHTWNWPMYPPDPICMSRRHMQPPSEAHLRLAEGADGRFSAESVDCPRVYHLNLVMRVRSRARTRTCTTPGLHLLAPIEAWWGLVLLAMHVALVQPSGQLTEDIEQEKMTPSPVQSDAQYGSISASASAGLHCLHAGASPRRYGRAAGRPADAAGVRAHCGEPGPRLECPTAAADKPCSPCMPPAGYA